MNELNVASLTAWHDGPRGKVAIASDVSFSAGGGSIFGIVGPNGCGKTTLLRALAGLHGAHSGTALLNGADICANRLTYVSQNFRQGFFPWTSLRTHLTLSLDFESLSDRERRDHIEAAADAMGVYVDLGLRPHQASGGMLQQVNLVLVAARNAPLLLADEPFSALDISVAVKLRRNFRKFVQTSQTIALLVLHDPAEILELCDRVLVIPDKPFSTQPGGGHHHAELIERRIPRGNGASVHESPSFASAMKKILDA